MPQMLSVSLCLCLCMSLSPLSVHSLSLPSYIIAPKCLSLSYYDDLQETAEQCCTLSTGVRNHFESIQIIKGYKKCKSGHRQSLVSLVRYVYNDQSTSVLQQRIKTELALRHLARACDSLSLRCFVLKANQEKNLTLILSDKLNFYFESLLQITDAKY